MGAPRSGGLRSIGQKLATLATHPNPSLEGRGYVLLPPRSVMPAEAGISLMGLKEKRDPSLRWDDGMKGRLAPMRPPQTLRPFSARLAALGLGQALQGAALHVDFALL